MASKAPNTATRKKLESKGQAMPGGRYPIPNLDFLKRAIRSIGRTPPAQRPAVVAWIKKRAAALGQPKLAANLSNQADRALELAGAGGGGGDFLPYGNTKKQKVNLKNLKSPVQKNGSGADKLSPQSKLKAGGLKTKEGQLSYAKLRAQGYPHKIAITAAKKHEQGLVSGEWSNDHIDNALELAGGPKFGSPQWDAKYNIKPKGKSVPASGSTAPVSKLGLKTPKAIQVYAKSRKKGLPHAIALKAAKMCDKQNAELSNSPKA